MEVPTREGECYVVASANGCTITDKQTGIVLAAREEQAGQFAFLAISNWVICDDPDAIIVDA